MIRSVFTTDECAWSASGHPPACRTVPPLGRGRPRGDERRQVAGRAARHEAAAGRGREAGEIGEPAQRLVLRVDRARGLEPVGRRRSTTPRSRCRTAGWPSSGAHGMNERKRGLSDEMHAGASVSRNQPSTVSGSWPCASIVGPTAAVSSAERAGVVERGRDPSAGARSRSRSRAARCRSVDSSKWCTTGDGTPGAAPRGLRRV